MKHINLILNNSYQLVILTNWSQMNLFITIDHLLFFCLDFPFRQTYTNTRTIVANDNGIAIPMMIKSVQPKISKMSALVYLRWRQSQNSTHLKLCYVQINIVDSNRFTKNKLCDTMMT